MKSSLALRSVGGFRLRLAAVVVLVCALMWALAQARPPLLPDRVREQMEIDARGGVKRAAGRGVVTQPPAPRPRINLSHDDGASFCMGCDDPYYEGIFFETWPAALGLRSFNVMGELTYGVPNNGSVPPRNDVDGRVVLLDRGGVTFLQKALNAQAVSCAWRLRCAHVFYTPAWAVLPMVTCRLAVRPVLMQLQSQ